MVDPELWQFFEILSHTRGPGSRIYLEVIWVGSPNLRGRKNALKALRGSSGPKGSLTT
ncbi:hypothetical protein CORC01_10770 [Colletotrichum orchidophilum]|uniref:Uncharacterized protein n=1 Tax=Colletotrichum orchidophilum TaxID=1209926 RepID=A0A1G4AXL3_9PEZI|nr:uncharacterized protein CORC01_10770 [Colletotrichum orchidophilum]OHE93871.1 hypothetical protein CORC01_10770 [Colletotrichum orchidophilum]